MDKGWKGFLTSASGGMLLIIVGVLWLLVIAGVLKWWILPVILIGLGIFFVVRRQG